VSLLGGFASAHRRDRIKVLVKLILFNGINDPVLSSRMIVIYHPHDVFLQIGGASGGGI
jgi:hypothetical protein